MCMNIGRPAPEPMNTTSKPYWLISSSMDTTRPMTMFVSTTPKRAETVHFLLR